MATVVDYQVERVWRPLLPEPALNQSIFLIILRCVWLSQPSINVFQ